MTQPSGPTSGDEARDQLISAYRTLGRSARDVALVGDGLRLGRVSILHGAKAEVLWFDDDGRESTTLSHVPAKLRPHVVAGDWVGLREDVIASVLARRSALRRPDPRRPGVQVLAANVDLVLLVLAIDRGLNSRLLERFAVMAWDSGAQPFVILAKADGAANTGETEGLVRSLVPEVDVLTTSALSGQGIERLRTLLHDGVTAVMLGASGAGKTSLLNALAGTNETTRAVSPSGDGRHATSTRRLFRLSGGGVLLDIPGIRLVDLAGQSGVDETFADIDMIAERCRFHNCSHRGDDGCAVESAVVAGALAPARLASWQRVQSALAPGRRPPSNRPAPARPSSNALDHRPRRR